MPNGPTAAVSNETVRDALWEWDAVPTLIRFDTPLADRRFDKSSTAELRILDA